MKKKLPEIPCENPDCRELFEPGALNQKTCRKPRCVRWKARENRRAYRERRGLTLAPIPRGKIEAPTWGDGCAVGSILWCPFPGIEAW